VQKCFEFAATGQRIFIGIYAMADGATRCAMSIDSTPTDLGGRSPLTVFTMLPAENPVLACLPKDPVKATSLETLAEQCLNLTELQTVVGNMHKEVAATADHLR
jgi:hypothetical protein